MDTTTINISLPKSLKDQVDRLMVAEGYGNTSEFIRDLIRSHLKEFNERRLEEMLRTGLESPASPWTKSDVEEIKKTVADRILANRNGG